MARRLLIEKVLAVSVGRLVSRASPEALNCGWKVMKLERGELSGDGREGYASIDTLKANVDITVRDRRGGHEWRGVKTSARCIERKTRGSKNSGGDRVFVREKSYSE